MEKTLLFTEFVNIVNFTKLMNTNKILYILSVLKYSTCFLLM